MMDSLGWLFLKIFRRIDSLQHLSSWLNCSQRSPCLRRTHGWRWRLIQLPKQSIFRTCPYYTPVKRSIWRVHPLPRRHSRFRNTQTAVRVNFPCSEWDWPRALLSSKLIWSFSPVWQVTKKCSRCTAPIRKSGEWYYVRTRTCNCPWQKTIARMMCLSKTSLVALVAIGLCF